MHIKIYLILFFVLFFVGTISAQTETYAGKSVFEKKCVSCHNTNHSLNFLNKSVFSSTIKTMVSLVNNGTMPPWYADTLYSRFKNEHILNKREKKDLITWLNSPGARTAKINPPKNIVRKPDLVLQVANGYVLPGDNKDHFVIFKIPYEIPHDTFVSSIEFVPKSSFKINHHLNYDIVPYNDIVESPGRQRILEVNQNGISVDSVYNNFGITNKNGYAPEQLYYGFWAPGMSATQYENPFSIFLPKKGFIITRLMHYSPSPIDVTDSCYFNIYFHKPNESKKYRKMQMLSVGSYFTDITPPLILKPGEKGWFHSEQTVPSNIIVQSMLPHMHLLGKKFIAYATYNNDTLPLVKIDNWNFEFQENYVFPDPIVLRKGTKIFIDGYFDNTSDNLQNPFSPPQTILGEDGMLTNGEMLLLALMYINADVSDDKNIKY